MNAQEIFGRVYIGIIKQGGPSINPASSECLYRSPQGRKCAVGQLLLDEFYNKEMEGKTVGSPLIDNGLFSSGVTNSNLQFVKILQNIHDVAAFEADNEDKLFVEIFKKEMQAVIKRYNLNKIE